MANIKFMLHIEDTQTPQQAVEIAQEIVAMLHCRLRGTPHTIEGKVRIPCPDCGKNMTINDRRLVCQDCEARQAAEWDREQLIKESLRLDEPMQSLEALLL